MPCRGDPVWSPSQGSPAWLPLRDDARAVFLVCACAALALGAFAALGSSDWLAFSGIVLLILVAALTLPPSLLAPVLAALTPLQFYFTVPDSAVTLRTALVFAVAITTRLIAERIVHRRDNLLSVVCCLLSPWMLPAALFLIAAFIAALAAPDRYLAFKGIYDWLAVFIVAFVAGETVQTENTLRRVVVVLVAAGVGEALLGLTQSALGVEHVVAALRLPFSAIFFQPNLLRDRLADMSFNWLVFDRVLPFGTFINGVDYAIFLAAILSLTLARLLAASEHNLSLQGALTKTLGLIASVLLMGSALLLTLKGSGALAFAGGAATLALLFAPRLSPRTISIGLIVLILATLLAAPFADTIVQRVTFLVQREAGELSSTGRLAIWTQLLTHLAQRPLFGFGLNNATLFIEPMRTMIGGAFAITTPAPESAYVATLIETGILGFVALASLLVGLLVRAYRNVGETGNTLHIGILAAIVALLCGNLTLTGLTTDQNGMLLGVLIGIVYGTWRLEIGS